jgi:broad specificity phosphatase PhoE
VILLARHGETAFNAERRFQGQGPVGLNDRGREQAAELARAAEGRGIVTLACSPLPRALETAQVVGAHLGLEPQPDPRFMEHDTGDWTGRLMADVEREEPELWAAYHATDPDFRFPGGESLEEQMERVVDGFVGLTQAGALPALVVCHRGVVRAARCHTDRRGLASFMDFDVPNGTLVAL